MPFEKATVLGARLDLDLDEEEEGEGGGGGGGVLDVELAPEGNDGGVLLG